MKEAYRSSDGRATVLHGDCVEVMKSLPDASMDAIVCDPPAGIAFMGREWDEDKGGRTGWVAWLTEVMREALRVLKPGGHAVVWALPRTSHWTAWALEDAGFEVRDAVLHVYGQGFPKSLDISKAIDALHGAERKVIGQSRTVNQKTSVSLKASKLHEEYGTHIPITAPATEEAKKYQGWGSNLKPSQEIWWLCRKPLDGTLAANTLKHGVGGLNIDGCRVTVDKTVGQLLESRSWEHDENLCDSCAVAASKSAKPETRATAVCIAAKNAALTLSAEEKMLPGHISRATATECSNGQSPAELSAPQTENLNLNTVASGEHQTAIYRKIPSFTTSMATNSTTGLKTCNSCGVPITGMSIMAIQSGQQNTQDAGVSDTPNIKQSTRNESVSVANANGSMGRFPANLLLSHSPSCVHVDADDDTDLWACVPGCPVRAMDAQSGPSGGCAPASGPTLGKLGKHGIYGKATGENMGKVAFHGKVDGASRFFMRFDPNDAPFLYQAKANTKERSGGVDGRNTHPTVKPIDLMAYLCRLVTPANGVVLDPFLGSGTTGVAALREGFRFIGIEREAEYVDIAVQRIRHQLGDALPKRPALTLTHPE